MSQNTETQASTQDGLRPSYGGQKRIFDEGLDRPRTCALPGCNRLAKVWYCSSLHKSEFHNLWNEVEIEIPRHKYKEQWESIVKKIDFDVYDFLETEILNCYHRYGMKKTVSFYAAWRMLAMELKPEIGQSRKDHPCLVNGWGIHARKELEKRKPYLIPIINHRNLDNYDKQKR